MKWIGIVLVGGVALLVGGAFAYSWWTNPRVIRELREDPEGERAQKVMLLTLPSGRGSVLIRGETLHGQIRVVEDDPELRESVFDRLRPTAPRWMGTLVVIELD